jgi:hypothetical protein
MPLARSWRTVSRRAASSGKARRGEGQAARVDGAGAVARGVEAGDAAGFDAHRHLSQAVGQDHKRAF